METQSSLTRSMKNLGHYTYYLERRSLYLNKLNAESSDINIQGSPPTADNLCLTHMLHVVTMYIQMYGSSQICSLKNSVILEQEHN